MRIGILIWDLALRGGAQRQAVEFARYLKNHGDEVTVYAVYYHKDVYPDILEGIDVRYLFHGPQKLLFKDMTVAGLPLAVIPSLVSEYICSHKIGNLVDEAIDVLNVHENLAFMGAVKWKKRTRKPVLWMMNDLPGVFYKTGYFRHGWMNRAMDVMGVKKRICDMYERHIREIDRIVVLDHRNRELLKNHVNIDSTVIRSGLDLGKFSCPERKPYGGGRPIGILSTGIFFPHRRLEDLVEAVRILKEEGRDVIWRHVGSEERDPAYARFVRGKAEESNVSSRCEFRGRVTDEELVSLYRSSDVFVFPNSPQTWGLAVFEAMACGTPVVVSRGAGASEVLTDGVDSLLVEPCRPEQIVSAIRRLADSPGEWTGMSASGRSFVENNIRWDLYALEMRAEMERIRP